MQLVCILCFSTLAFSQVDTRFTSQLQQIYSEVNYELKMRNMTGSQSSYIIDDEENREFINDVAQVIHLTTAIFLMLVGSHLEYS
jgi:hypothetical protein